MQVEQVTSMSGKSSMEAAPVVAANAIQDASKQPETTPQSTQTGNPAEPGKNPNDLSAQFASLTQREKKFLKDRKEFEEKMKSFSGLEKIKEAIEKKNENPLAILEAAGISFNDILDFQLKNQIEKDPNSEKMTSLEEKIAQLEGKLTEKERAEKQENDSREIESFRGHLKSVIDQDQEKFGLVAKTDSYDVVFKSVQNVVSEAMRKAEEDGEENPYQTRAQVEAIIPIVAEQVENQIFEALKNIQSLGKVKSLFLAESVKDEATQVTTNAAKAIPVPEVTLTNSSSVPATGTGKAPNPLLDRDESIRLAAAKLKAAWNKN